MKTKSRIRLTNKVVDDRLIKNDRTLQRVGDVVNASTPIEWQCNVCNNHWVTHPGSVLYAQSGCPICSGTLKLTNSFVDMRLLKQKRTLLRVGNVAGVYTLIEWQCLVCGNMWNSSPNSVLNKTTGCPRCADTTITNDLIDARLQAQTRPLSRKGTVQGIHSKIEWVCHVCDNIWKATPSNVLNLYSTCPHCAGKVPLTNDLVDMRILSQHRNISRIGEVVGASTKVEWVCHVCDNIWKATPDDVLNALSGCPKCNCIGVIGAAYFRKNPHKKNVPGLLYLIEGEINNKKFLKIGITEHTIKNRYKSDAATYQIKEITTKSMVLFDAYTIEQEILHRYIKELERPDDKFGGRTECLRYDSALLKDILDNYFYDSVTTKD